MDEETVSSETYTLHLHGVCRCNPFIPTYHATISTLAFIAENTNKDTRLTLLIVHIYHKQVPKDHCCQHQHIAVKLKRL